MLKHILIIDDDALFRRSLAFSLKQAGFNASTAESAEDGLALAQRDPPELLLLDIGLPGKNGLEALQSFKELLDVPVIFLTARKREIDEILGLELGADDYITKPFEFEMLLAHIKAVSRRTINNSKPVETKEQIVVGDMMIDPAAHIFTLQGAKIDLTPREFDLMHEFMLHPGCVLSINLLLSSVWGAEYMGEPQVVYVHVRWLREKIEEDPYHPKKLVTVHSVGYRLEAGP